MGSSIKWFCIVVILIVCLLPFLVPMLFGSGQNLDQDITISIPAPGSDVYIDAALKSVPSPSPVPFSPTFSPSPTNVSKGAILYSDIIQFKLSDCISSKSTIKASIYLYYIMICLMYLALFISFTDIGQNKYFSVLWLFIIASAVGASVWRYGSVESILIDIDSVRILVAGKKLDADQTKYFLNQFEPTGTVGQTLIQLKNTWRVLFFVTSIILCVIGMGLTFYCGYKSRPVLEPFLVELEQEQENKPFNQQPPVKIKKNVMFDEENHEDENMSSNPKQPLKRGKSNQGGGFRNYP